MKFSGVYNCDKAEMFVPRWPFFWMTNWTFSKLYNCNGHFVLYRKTSHDFCHLTAATFYHTMCWERYCTNHTRWRRDWSSYAFLTLALHHVCTLLLSAFVSADYVTTIILSRVLTCKWIVKCPMVKYLFYLFITLQHKCWRSVGLLVL